MIGGVGLSLPVQDELPPSLYLDLAVRAEQLGFDAVACGEIAGPETFAMLGAIAHATSRVTVGTAIVSTYTRSPALAAMGFATLDALAPGRVFAGIGSGSQVIVEGWHGRAFEHPLRVARSYVEDLRTAFAGGRIGSATESLNAPPFRLTTTTSGPIPVVLGAMHPGMLRLAGAVADGVLLAFCPVVELERCAALVREGAVAAGRDPSSVALVVSVNAYAGARQDEAMLRFRRFVLQYAVLPTHRAAIEASFPAIDDATAAWRAGDRKAALSFVDEDTVRRMCAIGSGADVDARVRELRAAGADLVLLHTLGAAAGDLDGARATLDAVAAAGALSTVPLG